MLFARTGRVRTLWVTTGMAVLAGSLLGCRHRPTQHETFPAVPLSPSSGASSVLRVGDMVTVSFSDMPRDGGLPEIRARIPGDGMLRLHYNIRVQAAERSIPDLERNIRDAYVPKLYKQLTAIVRSEERFFFVGGQVRSPSRLPLQSDLTVLRAIDAAGGFTDFANRRRIELRRENGARVIVNERKARQNPALDLPVLANDHIIVEHSPW